MRSSSSGGRGHGIVVRIQDLGALINGTRTTVCCYEEAGEFCFSRKAFGQRS